MRIVLKTIRGEMMNREEILHYWYYFCSLCTQLERTREYVEHKAIRKGLQYVLENRSTYSNEFLKLLLATASEFETVGKLLCKQIDPGFNDKGNIISITETILRAYPNIGYTIISTDFQVFAPLCEWNISTNENSRKHMIGLPWWDAYTHIKHRRFECYSEATLENCINALASLLVLELYLAMKALGTVSDLSTHRCDYFYFRYGHEALWVRCPNNLPDFSDDAKS